MRCRPHHALAVAAIFRDEAPFLQEWLAFHAGVGVEQFYLYDNFSRDDFRSVLAPWIRRGLVTLQDWPIESGQVPAYRHCIARHAGETEWIAFIDVDEFLFSPRAIDIRPILGQFRDLPGLLCYAPYFGSSGHRRRPDGPLLEAFTRRAPLTLASGKTIANPRWVRAVSNVHAFKYWAGETLDTDRRSFLFGRAGSLDLLRINHYWSRSLEDLERKVARGNATDPIPRDRDRHLEFEAGLNEEEDLSIIPIARAIGEGAGVFHDSARA